MIFIVYIISLRSNSIYLAKKTKITLVLTKKIIVLAEYLNFVNIVLKKIAIKLPKYLSINKYIIKLEKDKQLFYKLIYTLRAI